MEFWRYETSFEDSKNVNENEFSKDQLAYLKKVFKAYKKVGIKFTGFE